MKSPDFKSIESAFYSDGFQLGIKAVENIKSVGNIYSEVQKMYNLIDSMIDSFSAYAIQQNKKIECRKWCSWCCHQPVFALDYELDFLNVFIKKNFSESKLKIIQEHARNKREKLHEMEGEILLNSKFPCPLLA